MFKTNRIIKSIIGTKRHGGKNDWDGDGIPNKKDCQPRNVMRQDFLYEKAERTQLRPVSRWIKELHEQEGVTKDELYTFVSPGYRKEKEKGGFF